MTVMKDILIMFPCAGGNAKSYLRFSKDIQTKVIRIEYSGHGSRYDEPLNESFESLLDDVEGDIKEKIGIHDNIFLFGHSMGAYAAFETANRLIQEKYNVKCLMFAACPPTPEMNIAELDIKTEGDAKRFLSKMRQVPEKLLNSPFFREDLLHPIQNDSRILVDYIKGYRGGVTVDCPIVCFQGREDTLGKDMINWKDYTTKETMVHDFPGGHFFLYEDNNYEMISKYIYDIICQYGGD